MSATLGVLLKKLMPEARIKIFERLDRVAAESSAAWNNAGTGHSAFCELNYTPQNEDGSIEISKALTIANRFEESKQLWAYLIESEAIEAPGPFINDVPHMSLVWGETNVKFLRERYRTMRKFAMFKDMIYTEDPDQVAAWIPLMMQGRQDTDPLAATYMALGTDVNFGSLTRAMITMLEESENVTLFLGHEVTDLTQQENDRWSVMVENVETKQKEEHMCDYLFLGAGGGTLPLLDKSGIPEARGYGGFPISGQFLMCKNPDIIRKHHAKVYGKAAVGSPPMSVPHLDSRQLDDGASLLFGPYAGFSTKFLKEGSYLDLPLSIEMHNVWPILSAGIQNIALTKYLIKQVVQSAEDRFETLRLYYPEAREEDWELSIAGQRVQIIKKDLKHGGILKFGTEIVCSTDQTIAALLGASPGASTSASIMLDVLKLMFPFQMASMDWQAKIKTMIPTYGSSLIHHDELCLKTRARTTEILKLEAQS